MRMGGKFTKMLFQSRKFVAALLTLVILVSSFGMGLIRDTVPVAEAAQTTVDSDAAINGTSHLQSGSQTVFIDDQTGYKFFRDALGYCVYRKTTNAGASWTGTTTVDSQTDCVQITVWYDKWTPGSASSSIHIATLDTTSDIVWYNRLDTTNDNLLLGGSPVNAAVNSGQTGTITEGGNTISITRGTDGTIYIGSIDNTDAYVVECTVTCQTTTNWTETGTRPFGRTNNYAMLRPLAGGDIIAIHRDINVEDMGSKVWHNGTGLWDAATTTFDANATDNTTYDVGMAAVVSSTTPGNVYLAYIARNAALGTDDQIRGAIYNGTSWATTTDVITATTSGLTNVAMGLDSATNDVYVAYTGRTIAATANTGNVYWKWATSSMRNWSPDKVRINTTADDFYGLDVNIASDQRLFATWFDNTDDDIYSETIVDVFPGIHASGTGTQRASITASTTNVYVGGTFLLYENYKQNDVTDITITENGTIDASTDLTNIKLLYEMDTSVPYNCISESYAGTESQFGSTDTNGFSGANGVSTFSGSSVSVSTTSAMCAYIVLDILDSAQSSSTIDVSIANPATDVVVTGSTAGPTTAQGIASSTLVYNDITTQTHFHFRSDNGSEATASSSTSGTEDTALGALKQGSSTRLRIEVSNEGSTSTPAMQYRLEYGESSGLCSEISSWTDVGSTGGDFDMRDTPNLLDGGNTTNISVTLGGVTDSNPSFLTPNAGVKDTSSQTANITLTSLQFVELEYSFTASTTATQGSTYCFRVTDQGNALYTYSTYPSLVINADVAVDIATSTQIATTTIPSTNFYVGGAFTIKENTTSRNVTSIMLTENGTIDAQNSLENIKLFYDQDTTSPYNCADQSYTGVESQFGSTDTDGFAGVNGTSTFTGSVLISTSSTLCVYVVLDVTNTGLNGETINLIIDQPSSDIVVSGGGSVSPSTPKDMSSSTALIGAVLTQTHYHWRNDNGSEATSTSATGGSEDTAVTNVSQSTPLRLRMQVSNEGTATAPSKPLRLEYGTRITTCSAVASWVNVGDTGGAFDMFNSSNFTDGTNTTNIAVPTGGVTDENTTFLTPNSALKDTSSSVASSSLTSTQFIEPEFSIRQTADAGYDIPYCFRLSADGTALNTYTNYAQLTTAPDRDFEIQRGTSTITGVTLTITAGVNYTAPAASTSAFIRITNYGFTGAGNTTGGATQNARNVTAYILNPSNITNSITFSRPAGATSNTWVAWEIIEFVGDPGSDNEMKVRSQSSLAYGATSVTATGTAATGIVDDADVVVFITGQGNPLNNTTGYDSGLSTSAWLASSDSPVFTRGSQANNAVITSYAVVEFTGQNWFVQRNQHNYTTAGTTETEAITAVNSLSRTFIHAQKRNTTGLTGQDEFGHEVWLSSIGNISYFIESGGTAAGQTSVAWIIENTQTTAGAMEVTRSNWNTTGGTAPYVLSVDPGKTLTDLTNASIFSYARSAGTGTTYPIPIAAVRIASSTRYELWRSNTGANLTFRTEIVEWPTAGLAIRQNYYRLYTDSNTLNPTDPWPAGGVDLGENTVLTGSDEPLGEGERIRIRMTLEAVNATFPASTKSFRLQYGAMISTCSAITTWSTVGGVSSSTVWTGYNATGTTDGTQLSGDPPTGGDLTISVSDVAGTFEEENDTSVNAYAVPSGSDIEYDWLIEQNGANAETYYCFRMVESDNTPLDGYLQYPQIRTASFSPRTQNWRWYDNELNETPTTTLAVENVAPINIANGQIIKLRVAVKEIENISRDDVRFRLQYSEYADFSVAGDVVGTSTCTGTSTWCYANGGGADNGVITTGTLSDVESCVASVGNGCGTHNESPDYLTGFRHNNNRTIEYEFTIQSAGPRVNRVYYFRLYDIAQSIPVPANTSESYPSLVTEGAGLTFAMAGLASSTVIEGVTLDFSTTPTRIAFGTVAIDSMIEGAHRLSIDTNGTQGHQILMVTTGDLTSSSGAVMDSVTGTNAVPTAWNTGCTGSAPSCFGYHTSDDTLEGGSTRFSAIDTYARLSSTTPEEVSYSSQPVVGETTDVIFRLYVRQLQDAGQYESAIRYISIPLF